MHDYRSEYLAERGVEVDEPEVDVKLCPFVDGLDGHCRKDCAFYSDAGCAFITHGKPAFGGWCPVARRRDRLACSEHCAFYDNGCAFVKGEE